MLEGAYEKAEQLGTRERPGEEEDESPVVGLSLSSSECRGLPYASTVWCVRRTGVPLRPLPSFDGLPGAPSGRRSLIFLGTRKLQFSQASSSASKERRPKRLYV